MLALQPEIDEFLTGCRFTLGNFVLMMRKKKIHPTGMNINGFSQILHTHCAAFDMPPWSTLSKRCLPAWIIISFELPQRKISPVLFIVLIRTNPYALFKIPFGKSR